MGKIPCSKHWLNNGGFTLTHGLQGGSPALNAGDNTLTASTTDQRGATRISGIVDIGAVESQLTLSATAGNNQSTTVDTLFGTDLAVTLQNEFGGTAPGAGISITFTPATLGASGTFSGGNTVITNASGTATANPLQANTIIGNHTVAASLDGSNVNFNLTNTVGDAANVTIVNGNNQSAITNQTFNESLKVLITDDFGNPIANQTVTFAVPTAGASAILNQNSVTTDSNGFATVGLTANGNVGSYVILVNVDGTDGNTISLTNDLDIDALQYLVDRDQDPIDSLTNACQTVPAVKLELPSVERDDLGLDEMIELNEQCLPVAKN
ncbi:MAG: hypothetical protein HC799_15720 [Limnothrix sp. RL_2_0]|nr:hypothetical protein [Limnothrix sp. RL_2_0]